MLNFLLTVLVLSKPCPFAGNEQLPLFVPPLERKLSNDGDQNPIVDYDKIEAEIVTRLTTSLPAWPADFGNYGPFMIRLAWHCSGSYRQSDGRGGCDGSRIRFAPEKDWPDNENLGKAIDILAEIKDRHDAMSWGDLIVLTGNVAIKSMGGPILGFCGGRLDDRDGSSSLPLGPTKQQELITKCEVNGNCSFPLGPTTIGLIYVNPEGFVGNPDPVMTVDNIRSTFSRMGMDDRETVALIGGGHAFGKTHGACPLGPGLCGEGDMKGKGPNTFTSGFEGPWTTTPTKWSNEYFKNLLNYEWVKFKGPADHWQWKPNNSSVYIRMLTSDIALLHDDSYLSLVKEFSQDLAALGEEFAKAWYKLTSGDMGPAKRCKGNSVPPPQPFQLTLPDPTESQLNADYDKISSRILELIHSDSTSISKDTTKDGNPYLGALFVHLAYQCASTFRITDYSGGCNGARIRFQPELGWNGNQGMEEVISALESIKSEFGEQLSYADLIVLAGRTALEDAGLKLEKFSPGRVDAKDGSGVDKLKVREYYNDDIVAAKDNMLIMGLEVKDYVALAGRLRSLVQQKRLGYTGSYSNDIKVFGSEYFKILLQNDWEKVGELEYKAHGRESYITSHDYVLLKDPEFRKYVEIYANDEAVFAKDFATAWDKLSNAGMY